MSLGQRSSGGIPKQVVLGAGAAVKGASRPSPQQAVHSCSAQHWQHPQDCCPSAGSAGPASRAHTAAAWRGKQKEVPAPARHGGSKDGAHLLAVDARAVGQGQVPSHCRLGLGEPSHAYVVGAAPRRHCKEGGGGGRRAAGRAGSGQRQAGGVRASGRHYRSKWGSRSGKENWVWGAHGEPGPGPASLLHTVRHTRHATQGSPPSHRAVQPLHPATVHCPPPHLRVCGSLPAATGSRPLGRPRCCSAPGSCALQHSTSQWGAA